MIVASFVKAMPDWHRKAVWLQAEEGIDWRFDDEETRDSNPVENDDIVKYMLDRIWDEAGRWSNKRIQTYLDRGCESDLRRT